jgi:hypothetical protein
VIASSSTDFAGKSRIASPLIIPIGAMHSQMLAEPYRRWSMIGSSKQLTDIWHAR